MRLVKVKAAFSSLKYSITVILTIASFATSQFSMTFPRLSIEMPVVCSIAEYAEQNGADLVLIATHGRSGISRWA